MLPIILNLFLGILKFVCGSMSGMTSIAADASNNLTDAITSFVTLIGVKIASTLGGNRHINGHGRIEWVVGIVVSCSLIIVGWETLCNAVYAIRNPVSAEFNCVILVIMIFSIGIKIFLYIFYTKQGGQKESSAYRAEAADCISDAVSSTFVLTAYITDSVWHWHIDGWCGILVALFIIRNGLLSFAEIARRVLGEVENSESVEELKRYVLSYQSEVIREIADVQLIDYGYGRYGASFIVRAGSDADKEKFLLLITDLKSDIYKHFGYIATIQPEVISGLDRQKKIKEKLYRIMGELDHNLTVTEASRINEGLYNPQAVLYVAVPFEYSKNELEIYRKIKTALEKEKFSYTIKLIISNEKRNRRSKPD